MKSTLSIALVVACQLVYSQEQKLTARIVEAGTEKAISDVKIMIEGSNMATFTNHLGWFELPVDRSQHSTLTISHISYKILQVQIPAQDRFKLYLEKDTVQLKPLNLNDTGNESMVSQTSASNSLSDETEASYPGGWSKLYDDLGKALNPALTTVTEKGFTVNFTISDDGRPVDVQVSDPSAKDAVAAAFQTMPAWTPASQHGKSVRQQFMLVVYRFTKVELQPSDLVDIKTFISRQIKYPAQARRIGVEGPTFTKFTVDETGTVINIMLLEGVEASCNEEVKRVISIIPDPMLKTLSEKTHEREFILPIFFGLGQALRKGREFKGGSNGYVLPPIDVMAGGLTIQRRELGGGVRTLTPTTPPPVIVTYNNLTDALMQPRDAQRLTLRDNKLVSFPADILKLTNLTFLDLEQNQISVLPQNIDALSDLQELYLLQNRLTTLPNNFRNLKKLRTLGLANNLLTSVPSSVTALEKLEVLDMTNNQLTEIPKTINQMKNLETLVLMANKITHIPAELYELKKLKKIYLNGNPIDPKDIEVLKRTFKKTEISF